MLINVVFFKCENVLLCLTFVKHYCLSDIFIPKHGLIKKKVFRMIYNIAKLYSCFKICYKARAVNC